MGNQKSSDQEVADATPAAGDTPQQPSLPSEASKTTTQRRIVKAKKQVQDAKTNPTVSTASDDDEDASFEKVTSPLTATKVMESPNVARENEQEKVSQQTLERVSRAESRRLSKRNENVQHRRHRSPDDEARSTAATTASFLANPMSRFLSVFSVDASHPKRAHSLAAAEEEGDEDESASTKEPVEKRPRTDGETETDQSAAAASGDTAAENFPISAKMAILVAAAAVAIGWAFRWGRSGR